MPNVPSKCSERFSDVCSTETDGCCAIIPCTYCLEFEVYQEATEKGTADSLNGQWIGTIAGADFFAFWERVYGDCYFVVEIDGEEVYREACSDCKDQGGEVSVTIGYDSGTLRWTKQEPRPLPLITTSDGCRDHFCGDCDCTCLALCAEVTRPDTRHGSGELDLSEGDNDCSGPEWTGTVIVDAYDILDFTLSLNRDPYTGGCLLEGTIDGEPVSIEITSCNAIFETVTLYDGTVVEIRCKGCEDCFTVCGCPGRTTPMPSSLTVEVSDDSAEGCFDVTRSMALTEVVPCLWSGSLDMHVTCVWNGTTYNLGWNWTFQLAETGLILTFVPNPGDSDCPDILPPILMTRDSCDPLLFSATLDCLTCDGMFYTTMVSGVPTRVAHPPFCLTVTVSETI